MATYHENLVSRRNSIAAEFAAMVSTAGVPDTTKAGANPNQSGDGINSDHQGHRRALMAELKDIQSMIADAGGPREHHSIGIV